MTTKRTYFCNVCRDPIKVSGGEIGKDGYGFRFDQGDSVWSQQRVVDAENHICHPCLVAANAFAKIAKSD